MKIKSPLTNKREVMALCEAGANELFCGIEPYDWRKRFKGLPVNQRATGSNFTSLSDLEKAIYIAHQYKAKVHIAVNAFFYLEEQYRIAQALIKDVLGLGADGIIFADPVMLSAVDRNLLKDKDIIAGCDTVIFNSSAVNFYKKLGATRIVLPRSMTIGEIEELTAFQPALEYEVFIIHDLCFFEDGLCAFCKEGSGELKKEGRAGDKISFYSAMRMPLRGYGGGCRTIFSRQRVSLLRARYLKAERKFSFWEKRHIEGCGACAIYAFKKIGIASLKVLDRNMPIQERVKATAFIKEASGFLDNGDIPQASYLEKCRVLFKRTFKSNCNYRDCYYPLWKERCI